MTYSRKWTEECGSEDSQGRALWALGALVGRSRDPGRQSLGGDLFHAALPAASTFESTRGWAFALLGINEYLRAFQGDSGVEAVQRQLAERLLSRFERDGSRNWHWCEDLVSYDNARLPQALLVSGSQAGKRKDDSHGPSFIGVARGDPNVERGLLRSRRFQRLLSASFGQGAASTNSPSRLAPWFRPVSMPGA